MKTDAILFEYDCFCFTGGTSYNYQLFSDGRFVKHISFSMLMSEFPKIKTLPSTEEIITSPELASAVKKMIEENTEALKELPKDLINPGILDGANETITFGNIKFSCSNVLTQNMTKAKKWYKQNNQEVPDWVGDIIKLQKIFKKVEKTINEFVKVRLVG